MEIARPIARAASAPRGAVPKTFDIWQKLKYNMFEGAWSIQENVRERCRGIQEQN